MENLENPTEQDVTLDHKWVYVENGVVKDAIRVDPFSVFSTEYASQFIEAPLSVEIGWVLTETGFEPPPVVPPAPPVWEWYIDIGPFFDRFREFKMPVLTSNDPAIQAILKDTQIRKWVDLKRPDVAQSLAYIGSKISGFTSAIQDEILNSPLLPEENLALRKQYFS